jgi:hypothetical protein
VSLFRRKRDGEEQPQDTVEAPAAPDPAAWALPADAGAVTTDAGVAATDAEAADALEPDTVAHTSSEEFAPNPVPDAAAPPPAPEPAAATAASGSASSGLPPQLEQLSKEKPEVLVAGAFVGAFLFGRILKAITND